MADTNDLSNDIAAAFDAAETAPEAAASESAPSAAPVESSDPPPQDDSAAEGRTRDEKGRFAKTAAEKAAEDQAVVDEKPPVVDAQSAKPPVQARPEVAPTSTYKAPQSWKPAAREVFAKADPVLQAEVDRREREFQQVLRESSESRQTAQRFKEAVAPFEHMIRAEGGEPLQAVQGLLQTAALLRTAPMQTKAQAIARMVQTFLPGREGLELLDAALTPGAQMPQQAPSPAQYRDPRLDSILSQLEAQKQAQQATVQQQAEAALSSVQGEEFFEDVRLDMADILESYAKRGVDITPKDAYNRAIRLHPEVSKVLEQRDAARAATPQGATQRRNAASSIKASPAKGPGSTQERSLRDEIEAALGER